MSSLGFFNEKHNDVRLDSFEKSVSEICPETLNKDFSPEAFYSERFRSIDSLNTQSESLNNTFRDCVLPDDMVLQAVSRACEFFNIPEVPVYNSDSVCVWPKDNKILNDDIFGFNRQELMELGVRGEDSLTLIYTHECAHRALQGKMKDAWEEELACDFFSGLNAGLNNINIDNVEASLGSTEGGPTHPHGALRVQFIEAGQKLAHEMQLDNNDITFEDCLSKFEKYYQEKSGLVAEYRDRFDPYYFNMDESVSTSNTYKGFVNDKDWHLEEARKATERGDQKAARVHIDAANMCSK